MQKFRAKFSINKTFPTGLVQIEIGRWFSTSTVDVEKPYDPFPLTQNLEEIVTSLILASDCRVSLDLRSDFLKII